MAGGAMPEQGGGGGRRRRRRSTRSSTSSPPSTSCPACITFLLYTAVWTQISRLQVQQLGTGAPEPLAADLQQKALAVTLAVGERGMALSVGDASYDIPSLGRSPEGVVLQDLKSLDTRLKALKGEYPDQGSIIVTAEDTVPYGDLVHVIDACLGAGLMQVSVSGV